MSGLSSAHPEPLLQQVVPCKNHRSSKILTVLFLFSGLGLLALLLRTAPFSHSNDEHHLAIGENAINLPARIASVAPGFQFWQGHSALGAQRHPASRSTWPMPSASPYTFGSSPGFVRSGMQINPRVQAEPAGADDIADDTVEDIVEGTKRVRGSIPTSVWEERAGMKVAVLGSGRFGTALGAVIARNGYPVSLVTRKTAVAESINTNHTNPSMKDYKLPGLLISTTDVEEAVRDATFIVHTIPVQYTEAFLEQLKDFIPANVPIISCSKGLQSETLETMSTLIPRVLGRAQPVAIFSGPTFAQELLEGYPSGAVVAAEDPKVAERCAALFNCAAFRAYTSTDVVGVEIGGALKNVYALAAGAIEGMGFGINTVSFLVTRACAEMNLIGVAMGAKAHTMAGLAGIGDLMLTCMGGLSRNKAVGLRLGKGESLASVLESRGQSMAGVAEGVATTPAAAKLAKRLGVEAPLINAVAAVLEGKRGIAQAALLLMTEKEFKQDFSAAAHVMEKRMNYYQKKNSDRYERNTTSAAVGPDVGNPNILSKLSTEIYGGLR